MSVGSKDKKNNTFRLLHIELKAGKVQIKIPATGTKEN